MNNMDSVEWKRLMLSYGKHRNFNSVNVQKKCLSWKNPTTWNHETHVNVLKKKENKHDLQKTFL